MELTISCGKHLAEHADLSGSRFHDVNLGNAEFDDVNMSNVRLHNINMSDMTIEAVQIGGTTIRHVGLPPGMSGGHKQRPVLFHECDLNGSTIKQCDLANVRIENCNLDGATIDGVPVADLLATWKANRGA